MGHAQKVSRLIVWQYTIDGLIANDHALLMIEFTSVWWHIATGNMHCLRVGNTGHQLGSLTYGYVVGFVRDKVLRLTFSVYAGLKLIRYNNEYQLVTAVFCRGSLTSSTTKAPLDFIWNCKVLAMARLKFIDQMGSPSLKTTCDIVPFSVRTILKGLYGGYISLF